MKILRQDVPHLVIGVMRSENVRIIMPYEIAGIKDIYADVYILQNRYILKLLWLSIHMSVFMILTMLYI